MDNVDACIIFIFSDILVITTPEVNHSVDYVSSIPVCGCNVILLNGYRYCIRTANDSYTFNCETKNNLDFNLKTIKSYIREALLRNLRKINTM